MSVGNRMRLSTFDDYYWYDGYNNWKYNNYGYSLNTPWNSYYYWNNYFNPYNRFDYYYSPYYSPYYTPYYNNVIIVNPKTPGIPASRPRSFNPSSYTNNNYNNSNLY